MPARWARGRAAWTARGRASAVARGYSKLYPRAVKAYRPPGVTKTTFLLADSRRARLKAVAAARGVTVTDLLTEGADLVLAKYREGEDAAVLQERARRAREQLRAGLHDGPAGVTPDHIDDVVYATRRPRATKRAVGTRR